MPKLPIAQIQVGTGRTNLFFRVEGKSELSDEIVLMSTVMVAYRLSRILSRIMLDRLWIERRVDSGQYIVPPFTFSLGLEAANIAKFFQQVVCARVIDSEQCPTLGSFSNMCNNSIFICLWFALLGEFRRHFEPITRPPTDALIPLPRFSTMCMSSIIRINRAFRVECSSSMFSTVTLPNSPPGL
jgi:hypothetical protein